MDAIVRSPLPSVLSEACRTAGPLRSTGITPLPRYCGPVRHPLAVGRFPGRTGYTAYPAPPISRRDEEGFSSCLTCPMHRAVAHTPPEGTRRVSQPATLPAAFAHEASARPPESFVEAILTFTHVTARSLAPIRPMVLSMGFRALVSRHPAIQATGRLAVAPVGLPPTEHVCLLWTHTSSTTTVPERTSRSTRTPRSRDSWSTSTKAGSSRRPWSAGSIIATHAGGVGSFRPAGVPARLKLPVGRSLRLPRSSSALRLNLHTEHVGPRGVSFGVRAQCA